MTAEVHDIRKTLVGVAVPTGESKTEWMGRLLDSLRVFVIKTNQITIAAQDVDEKNNRVTYGTYVSMADWITAERKPTLYTVNSCLLNSRGFECLKHPPSPAPPVVEIFVCLTAVVGLKK